VQNYKKKMTYASYKRFFFKKNDVGAFACGSGKWEFCAANMGKESAKTKGVHRIRHTPMFCKKTCCKELEGDSSAGASVSAGSALGAHIGVDTIDITFRNSAHGAFVFASTASDTIGRNFVSHGF
jgi:hypothetical protein